MMWDILGYDGKYIGTFKSNQIEGYGDYGKVFLVEVAGICEQYIIIAM